MEDQVPLSTLGPPPRSQQQQQQRFVMRSGRPSRSSTYEALAPRKSWRGHLGRSPYPLPMTPQYPEPRPYRMYNPRWGPPSYWEDVWAPRAPYPPYPPSPYWDDDPLNDTSFSTQPRPLAHAVPPHMWSGRNPCPLPPHVEPPNLIEADGVSSTVFTVSNSAAGAIIGKGGSRIRIVRRDSGADISIGEGVGPGADRDITIRGTPEQVRVAYAMLQRSIAENTRPNLKSDRPTMDRPSTNSATIVEH